jgi:hypothetical protein
LKGAILERKPLCGEVKNRKTLFLSSEKSLSKTTILVIIIEVLLPRREKGFREVMSDAIQGKSGQGKC